MNPSDLEWAKQSLNNVMLNCYLNLALTDIGASQKYFAEMLCDEDLQEYFALLKRLHGDADEAFLYKLRQQFAKLRA